MRVAADHFIPACAPYAEGDLSDQNLAEAGAVRVQGPTRVMTWPQMGSVMDKLGLRTAHVVGAPMGGMIAQLIAANYPDRTRSLNPGACRSWRKAWPAPAGSKRHCCTRGARSTIEQVPFLFYK